MNEKILKWLFAIQSAIDEIESFFEDYPKDFNQYKSNLSLNKNEIGYPFSGSESPNGYPILQINVK